MRKSLRLLLAMLLLLSTSFLYAQEKIITGVVLDDEGSPVVGANIKIKGSDKGTQTDAQGSFKIPAKKGDVLEVTSVGYARKEYKVGDASAISINMVKARSELSEVVVAMDIRRNSRELGYSAQGVGGKEVQETQRENFVNGLQGRVAGLTVNPTGGAAGASSQIVLRGFNSLSLNNQPLFVVDGIILDNSTMNETSNGGTALGLASDRPNRNNDYTNRIADLNPSDIASYTILKGPEATALYGSQAAGGAIIITTKKAGTNKFAVAYDNSFRFQEVTRYAEVNNEFGPGSNGVGGNSFNASLGSYFGPRYPASTPHYDNIKSFFRTGFSQTHNLSADWGMKNVGFKISGSIFDQQGVVPENDYKKYNVRLTNTTKIGKMIEFTPSIQYIHSTNDKPLRSAGGFLLGLYIWPVNNDVTTYTDVNGNKQSIFSTDPFAEIDNPLYNVHRNHSFDKTDRYIFSAGININPTSWLTLSGRFGYDTYKSQGYTFYHPLSFLTTRAQLGSLDNYWRWYYGYNHTVTATAKKTMGKWSGRVMVGQMWQDYQTEQFAIYGTGLIDSLGVNGQMYKKGQIVNDGNFEQVVGSPMDSGMTRPNTRVRLLQNNFGRNNKYITRQSAYFGEVAISYNNVAFLSYTHRFESASVFAADKRNYNYPGASLSVIMSDIFPGMQKGGIIDYWKLRSSVAGTARLADPYKNQSVFVNNFASTQTGAYSFSFDNNNPYLEPERQTTFEAGTEVRFLNSRISLDFDYYNTYCYNQIASQYRASYATGYVLNTANSGTSRNQGIEITLDVNPVRAKDFNWNVRFNFNRMWSKVLKLPASIQQEFYLSDTWLYQNARGGVTLGGTTTTITGFHYQRNNRGDILITPSTGLPVVEQTFTVIGDRAPDFTLGTLNNLRYKNWNLSFLWDLKVGGDMFNATEMYLTLQGKSPRTADRETPRVIKGVLNDGLQNSANPTPNTIAVTPYYASAYYSNAPTNVAEEEFVQKDVNYLRLRDVTLTYNFPQSIIRKWKFIKSLGIFGTGNDLLIITNYRGADPSVNGNTAGSTGVGAFGFDYGTLPAPVSVNFGLRAGF